MKHGKRYRSGAVLLALLLALAESGPRYAAAQAQSCFPETGHCIGGRFAQYWRENGGLAGFGYPLRGELTQGGRTVPDFARPRFELHPPNAAPHRVLLGLLGEGV